MSLLATLDPARTYDLAAFAGWAPAGQIELVADPFAGGGAAATGIVKLCQWVVAALLTAPGSVPLEKAAGTGFWPALRSGALRTDTAVYVAFSFAAGDLLARARALQTAATPPDEALAGLELAGVAIAAGSLRLAIAVTTAAGTSRTIVVPLPVAA